MKQRFLIHILIVLTFLSAQNVSGQVLKTEYSFSIKQTVLPGPHPEYEYIYNKGQLTILEINKNWKKEQPIEKKKKLFKIKFSENQKILVDSIILKINIESLDTLYSNPTMDGAFWTFSFTMKDNVKEVVLDNYYLKKLDSLILYINKQIPERKRLISLQ